VNAAQDVDAAGASGASAPSAAAAAAAVCSNDAGGSASGPKAEEDAEIFAQSEALVA